MNFNQWALAHRSAIRFLFGLLACAGIFAALQLSVSLFPTVEFPRVVVSLDAGDQPAQQMEMLVTRAVE
jgi:multidrug efflux pump subunit AcrB